MNLLMNTLLIVFVGSLVMAMFGAVCLFIISILRIVKIHREQDRIEKSLLDIESRRQEMLNSIKNHREDLR